MMNVLYIHGMGGGGDSRIPGILRDWFSCQGGACTELQEEVNVVVRTYSFDPDVSRKQIDSWVEELDPCLVIGESLGSVSALRIRKTPSLACVPHIFVSPSLNAPLYLGYFAWLSLLPGITPLFDHIYKPRPGDRQPLHFIYPTLKKYRALHKEALADYRQLSEAGIFAFFGTKDHYRKSGIVSIRSWEKLFGKESFEIYDGTHFMEEEFIYKLLIPKIIYYLCAHVQRKHNS